MRHKFCVGNFTESLSSKDIKKKWILIDADGVALGRLAAFLSHRLRGKHRVDHAPNADCGDHIVVINCAKVGLTGKKNTDKPYRHHSGYPGGLKEYTAKEVRNGKNPCDMVRLATKRMLSRSPLFYKQISKNLHLFPTEQHRHEAQTPEVIDFKVLNVKNSV